MPPKNTTSVVSSSPVTRTSIQSFDPNKYVTSKMNLDSVLKLKEVFDLFDSDKSGQISIPQIVQTIQALDFEKEAKNIISIVQNSTTAQQLDFKTFIDIFGQPEQHTETTLRQLYEVFDPNGTNCFGPEDFERVCEIVGQRFSPQQVDQMIDYADKDRDGGISFEQFAATVTKQFPKV